MAKGLSDDSRLRAAAEPTFERLRRDAAGASPGLRAALGHLARNVFDPALGVAGMSEACGLSITSLGRRFRAELGVGPGGYVAARRCDTAERLLEDDSLELAAVAAMVGFPSLGTFIRAYRRLRGQTPGATQTERAAELRPALGRGWEDIRRSLLGQGSAEELQELADTVELAHRLRRPLEDGEVLGKAATKARLEARALELLRPRFFTWSPEEQRALALKGYRPSTPAYFRRLARLSREEGRDDRAWGLRWAELALESVRALPRTVPAAEISHLLAEGYANLGNARRLLFDLEGSERALVEAEAELAKHPAPAELEAEILWAKGVLLRTRQRFSEARGLLDRSLALAEEPGSRARVLLARGLCHELEGNGASAETDVLTALKELEKCNDDPLRSSAHARLAALYARRGEQRRAQRELVEARRWAPKVGSRRLSCRLGWIEALSSHARGRGELAERRLLEARAGFSDLGDPLFTALVGLDLALLWCEQGRGSEVGALMAEALPDLEKLCCGTEEREALRRLQRAADRGKVTAGLIEGLRARLEMSGEAPRRPSPKRS